MSGQESVTSCCSLVRNLCIHVLRYWIKMQCCREPVHLCYQILDWLQSVQKYEHLCSQILEMLLVLLMLLK